MGERSIQADQVKAYNDAHTDEKYIFCMQYTVTAHPQLNAGAFEGKVGHLAEPAILASSNRSTGDLPTTTELAADPSG